MDEDKYRQKYKDIKRRIHDVEEDNDILNVRLHKARKNIGRLRLERTFLLERIEKSREHFDGDSEDSDGMSDILSHNDFDLHHSHGAHRRPGIRIFEKPQRRKKDPNAPKGPGNVFFLYCRLERDKIKDQYPNENLGDVTKLLGQKWKSLTKDEKQKYYDMYKKEQEEYEVAMKSYNKEAPNTSLIREPSPQASHTSPLPTDDLNSTASFHAISSQGHGTEMALNLSRQGSSVLDEDEDLMESEPLPTRYQTTSHEIDAVSDELIEDEYSNEYQVYRNTSFQKHSNSLPRDLQDQSKYAPIEESAPVNSNK